MADGADEPGQAPFAVQEADKSCVQLSGQKSPAAGAQPAPLGSSARAAPVKELLRMPGS